MPFVLRQSQDEDNPRLPDAYGKQITAGRLVFYDEGAPRRFIIFLCRGGEHGCEGVDSIYYHGAEILQFAGVGNTDPNWVFHPGTVTKQIEPKECTASSKNEWINCVGHGYANDTPVRLRVIDGEMPGGLKAETQKYYVVNSDTDHFQVSETLGGAELAISSNGTGTLIVWKADAGIDDPVQGKPYFFNNIDYTFSGICYVEGRIATTPTGVGPQEGEPDGFKFVMKCRKVADHDNTGAPLGSPSFSANNARVAADILLSELNLPASRIDWQSWFDFKEACNQNIWHRIDVNSSFTTGSGLTGKYFNHPPMTEGEIPEFTDSGVTPVKTRTGEEVNFNFDTAGVGPAGLNANWFLVRWEGKLKPAFSEPYTFKIAADNGIRLWVGDTSGAPMLERWSNTVSHWTSPDTYTTPGPLVKNELVDFKLEYFEATGEANVGLKWVSQSHPEEYIPKTRFYPGDHIVKRYEAHLAIPSAMTAWQAFEEVMERAPGWHWQDVSGKIVFLPPDRAVKHEFVYDPGAAESVSFNIASKTFEASPRAPEDRINYQRYEFRDVEAEPGYTQSYLESHRTGLRELQGGLPSDTPLVRMGVMSRSLAERVAETRMKLLSDPERQFVLRGQLDSYKISKGDRVTLSHFLSGDTSDEPVDCIVTAETTGGNADEKTYTLLPVTFPLYEDEEA